MPPWLRPGTYFAFRPSWLMKWVMVWEVDVCVVKGLGSECAAQRIEGPNRREKSDYFPTLHGNALIYAFI